MTLELSEVGEAVLVSRAGVAMAGFVSHKVAEAMSTSSKAAQWDELKVR